MKLLLPINDFKLALSGMALKVITATFEKGVLKVTIPYAKEAVKDVKMISIKH